MATSANGAEPYPSRRKARKHAVEVLYSAEARGEAPETVLRDTAARLGWSKHPWFAFARELVAGVGDETAALDELIASTSEHWTIERMPRTDLAILRVAAWELEHETAPSSVVVSEAVHLANELSTDRSGAFINGVLGRIAAQRGPSGSEPAPAEGSEPGAGDAEPTAGAAGH